MQKLVYLVARYLTLRHNTERPITIDEGTNTLVGTDPAMIVQAAQSVLNHGAMKGQTPALWDGMAAQRIVAHLGECLEK